MSDLCDDNRFELIEKYKKELIEATNIETAPDEMAVLDDILFRFWQMGWLDSIDRMLLVKESCDMAIKALESQPEHLVKESGGLVKDLVNDTISRQMAVKEAKELYDMGDCYCDRASMIGMLNSLPSAQPERKYTLEEVAEILASVIGDECACNINGIDEWLPESCKYTEIRDECPNPKEKHGCWMQFLLQGGAQI